MALMRSTKPKRLPTAIPAMAPLLKVLGEAFAVKGVTLEVLEGEGVLLREIVGLGPISVLLDVVADEGRPLEISLVAD